MLALSISLGLIPFFFGIWLIGLGAKHIQRSADQGERTGYQAQGIRETIIGGIMSSVSGAFIVVQIILSPG